MVSDKNDRVMSVIPKEYSEALNKMSAYYGKTKSAMIKEIVVDCINEYYYDFLEGCKQ